MLAGIINIALGVVGVVLGINGRVLAFTHSSEALLGVAGGLVALGAYQVWRARRPG